MGSTRWDVVFDVGNVLLRWAPPDSLRNLVDPSEVQAWVDAVFSHADWVALDRGSLETETAMTQFAARLDTSEEEVRRVVYGVVADMKEIEPNVALLAECRARGHRTFALTNMGHLSYRFLSRRFTFWDGFEGHVVSAELKLMKPEAAIYQHLLDEYELDPKETVFIDDNEENVRGAERLGLRGVHADGKGSPRESLLELEILG